jgi:uncharacterized protein (UPF0261 family)
MATIAVLGSLDTKGAEHQFVADCISRQGHQALLIDVGTQGTPQVNPHISREAVSNTAELGLASLDDNLARQEAMSLAAPILLSTLFSQGKIHGVISLAGVEGTAIATSGMRGLPLGFPKLMVSTLANENTTQYAGVKDIVMMPSIVDIAGLNRVSRPMLTRAAGAICGMVEAAQAEKGSQDRPLIFATIFGNTTNGVNHARNILEEAGYEIIVFHATGVGGRTMEALLETGVAAGVLDFTTTECADEVVGGVLSAGPTRLEAAAKSGTPAIVTLGCLDMVNFFAREAIPAKFRDRTFYEHNPQVTLMRTNEEEAVAIGTAMAQRINQSTGPVSVLLPLKGISAMSGPGYIFHDPIADEALFSALRRSLRSDIPVISRQENINEPAFAEACARELLKNIEQKVLSDRERRRRRD